MSYSSFLYNIGYGYKNTKNQGWDLTGFAECLHFMHEKWNQHWYIGLFHVANEPGFLVPIYYNYVGRPDKTAEITRKTLALKYNDTRKGLPGNDDSGSMSAWYIFHSMGFYPNAGQDIYLISSPVFEKTKIKLESGNSFVIKALNTSSENIYIQSASLNGKNLERCWLTHNEIISGGVLEFVMGNKPSLWGQTGIAPFSMSTGESYRLSNMPPVIN